LYIIGNTGNRIDIFYKILDDTPIFKFKNGQTEINVFNTLFENKVSILTNNKLMFNFINFISKESDPGIDAGALTRTVFKHLSLYLSEKYFVIDYDTKLYNLNVTFEENMTERPKFFFIGQLFGIAIKLNLQIYIELTPFLLYQLTHDLVVDQLNEIQIINIIKDYDIELLNKTPYTCYNSEIYGNNLISKATINYCKYINITDDVLDIPSPDVLDIPSADQVTQKIINILSDTTEITKQFVAGFRSQININATQINNLSLNLLNILIAGTTKLDLEIFTTHLTFEGFTEKQKTLILQIISENIDLNGGDEKYLKCLLEALTGTTRIPALGYPTIYPLAIKGNDSLGNLGIHIHSCFNYIDINLTLFNNEDISSLKSLFTIESLRLEIIKYDGH